MVLWVFGYGSLIWKAGFNYDERLPGFVTGYRRVFYQGSTDHRGTPEYPGRTVTLEPAPDEICYGVAYKISQKEDIETAITYLEVREKQYDQKVYLDFYTESTDLSPTVSSVLVYVASSDTKLNQNYLGPAPLEEIAEYALVNYGTPNLTQGKGFIRAVFQHFGFCNINHFLSHIRASRMQIVRAKGPSGPNRDYLFQLEQALLQLGCMDPHVMDLGKEVRRILSTSKEVTTEAEEVVENGNL